MNENEYMPEPWELAPSEAEYKSTDVRFPAFMALSIGRNDMGSACIVPLDESNRKTAERIVACVNACVGIEDPGVVIAELRRSLVGPK